MISADLGTLSATAITIGFLHCICGPDHYVPFVAMSRVGLWSLRKTVVITVLCGVGHVASSALLGFIGIALGIILLQLETAEQIRGDLAAWMLIVFGTGYLIWGIIYALRYHWRLRKLTEAELQGNAGTGDAAAGDGDQADSCAHGRGRVSATSPSLTPWILFTIFLFGPCEPLIPLVMYPAARANVWNVVVVTLLFGLTTLATMTTLVVLMYLGTFGVRLGRLQVYGHALAGFVVLSCGLAIKFLAL